jgi:hypothetical protein
MTPKKRRPGAPSRPAKELPLIGKILRTLRGSASMESAAEKIGKSGDWWHFKEIGRTSLNFDDLQAIAAAYGFTWTIDGDSVTLD